MNHRVHNPHLKFELCVNPTFVSFSLKFPWCLYPNIVHIGLVHIEYVMFTPDNLSRDKMKNDFQVCFPRTFIYKPHTKEARRDQSKGRVSTFGLLWLEGLFLYYLPACPDQITMREISQGAPGATAHENGRSAPRIEDQKIVLKKQFFRLTIKILCFPWRGLRNSTASASEINFSNKNYISIGLALPCHCSSGSGARWQL